MGGGEADKYQSKPENFVACIIVQFLWGAFKLFPPSPLIGPHVHKTAIRQSEKLYPRSLRTSNSILGTQGSTKSSDARSQLIFCKKMCMILKFISTKAVDCCDFMICLDSTLITAIIVNIRS